MAPNPSKKRLVFAVAMLVSAHTRIPVWSLVHDRQLGMSDARILEAFPGLTAVDLVNAWAYAEAFQDEIEAAI